MNDEVIAKRLLFRRIGALGLLVSIRQLLPVCAGHAVLPAALPGTPSTLSGELIDPLISEHSFTMGLLLNRSLGETATLVREDGGHPSQARFVGDSGCGSNSSVEQMEQPSDSCVSRHIPPSGQSAGSDRRNR